MRGKVRRSGGQPRCRAEGAEVERHRIWAPKAQSAPKEVGCKEGLCPSPEIFFPIFELKKVSSGLLVHLGCYFLQSVV